MRHAAFFRNLNLGRTHAPNRTQFEAAFHDAGSDFAASFLTNGTMVFEAADATDAQALVERAIARLVAVCGLREPALVRDLPYLARLVASDPFADVDRATVYDCYATFMSPQVLIGADTPHRNAKGDVEVLRYTAGEALTLARQFGASPGSPNAFIEKQFGLPATTRAWNTVVRLVAKFA
ncbi:Uncharacterized conserved protein, DUF1697 family [Andreprevotia lacus DSM 23236]|jgi:uncharacterized protein (DUF1697 family)|uniref:Uncharacterized conserved protein, DUF1697 family n=1 Tax=Andreprevotia lacus DSM 23236 TaxID=1121001 RepID=A0A1W1XWH9_9NEIS|nr:DUF1697 domain-containing protein [Andreprevotia lacus]SMC28286.1 Uncharacterized conserved protein, DUF1697 family [Andreprevotia lacus DSM 23236]